ncbi:BREX-1 system adenine-specific DNA-methyltransferase PglX [Devosia lacusdianchii]|uniref:BREX-1 system adenine-specific DNA-methyltransferase PglX n=1 Tax=Devosia lacusdianchii TaxID=2917991 RepID=UPI001F052E81|nr:BREX-1 system adenine-specific DNA-methyltransferase PglX [Devosia sp. JXJ CY 41]
MDTNALKKFAQAARNQLMDQVRGKLGLVLAEGSAARREAPQAVRELEAAISLNGREQVVEQVAYTWFNRFTALRFMDANGLTSLRAVSPADGQTRPELLAEALAGNVGDDVSTAIKAKVLALLDGRSPSSDPQGEAYRLLLVTTCNQWHERMPFMFEKISDFTELLMPDDLLSQNSILAHTRNAMNEEACQDVEVIGWLYQFYISEKKDQVFAGLKKNQKITAENIPAATQLFTPHWIVRYLVENSLGRLWLLNRPGSKLAERMDYYIAPEEPETDFLRIQSPKEIKVCDPACGSAHMLTYAFDLLYAIYEEEGFDPSEIPALILEHNLTGIEIDDRAGALAAFALAMKAAARLGRRRFLRLEVKPNIVVLQNISFTPTEMQDVAAVVGRELFSGALRETLLQFEQAKNLGSLIVPKVPDPTEALLVVEARTSSADLVLKPVLERVLNVLRMAKALSSQYHVAIANPPYMGGKGLNGKLGEFVKVNYPDSKSDLFAVFMEVALRLGAKRGLIAMINMQSWMFLSSYEKLRGKLLSNATILSMAHIGERGFDTIGGAVVSTTAFVIKNAHDKGRLGDFIRLIDGMSEREKILQLREAIQNPNCGWFYRVSSDDITKIPSSPIVYWQTERFYELFRTLSGLSEIAKPRQGATTSDNDRFLRAWTEVSSQSIGFSHADRGSAASSGCKWFPYNKGGEFRRWYGNQEFVINYKNDGEEIKEFHEELNKTRPGGRLKNQEYYFCQSVSWSKISTGSFAVRYFPAGFIFDVAGSAIFFERKEDISYFIGLLNSTVATSFLQALSPTLNFEAEHLSKIPVFATKARDEYADNTSRIVEEVLSCSMSDWDDYETSWGFASLPLLSSDLRAKTLADTYANLLAHWQSMTDKMRRLEEDNNRIFIDAYGLRDQLTPKVPLDEITLTCNPAYRYGVKGSEAEREVRLLEDTVAEFLHYAVGCMFGRYSLDTPGLVLANQGERLEDYLDRVPSPTFMPDKDNVIPVLDGEWFADDVTERFRKFLRVTFGEDSYRENLAFVEKALGKDIRKWFTRDFFDYHVRRFKKRPIYWLFSSPKGTFQALMYMHRYRPETVSVLLNDYLREHIRKLEGHRVSLEKQADDPSTPSAKATKARKDIITVSQQIDELKDWERDVIFPLAQQRIEIDLDDGVKSNYPKFGAALRTIKGLEATDE